MKSPKNPKIKITLKSTTKLPKPIHQKQKPFRNRSQAPNGRGDEIENVRDQRPLQLPRKVGALGHVDPGQKKGGHGGGQGPHEEEPLEFPGALKSVFLDCWKTWNCLVVLSPTPLKNDGVSNSWHDEIPKNALVKH